MTFVVPVSASHLGTEVGIKLVGGNHVLAVEVKDTVPNSAKHSVIIVQGSSSPANGKFFIPNILNISTGSTVKWTNNDLTSYKSFEVEQLHTVTSGSLDSGVIGTEFDSGFLTAGKSFQHTFESVGTFDYFCTIHPFMTGKIIVG